MTDQLNVTEIEAELARRGMTVAALCRKAGINQSTWQRWKTGRFEPRGSSARRLRAALTEIRESVPALDREAA